MRKLILLVAAFIVLIIPMAVHAQDELSIFIWSEYMDEEKMPADFEKKFGIKVRLDIFENNEEMVAKLQAGGVSQYDIIVPSDYIIPILIQQKLIQPLDHGKIPNLKNLFPRFTQTENDPGNKWSVPWQWGTVGLMYRKDKLTQDQVKSWAVLFDPEKSPGPFWLIDSVREMLGIALLYQGHPFNSDNPDELKSAADLLAVTKKRSECLGFKHGVGGKNDVGRGHGRGRYRIQRRRHPVGGGSPGQTGLCRSQGRQRNLGGLHVHPDQGAQCRCGPQMDQLDSGTRSRR